MKVKCPRCGRIHIVPRGQPDVECDCHLYCEDGDKPSDCTLVDAWLPLWDIARWDDADYDRPETGFTGAWQWPMGMHTDSQQDGEDTQARRRYCTVHNKYVNKVPFLIEADWSRWHSRRAPKRLRMSHGKY